MRRLRPLHFRKKNNPPHQSGEGAYIIKNCLPGAGNEKINRAVQYLFGSRDASFAFYQ
jgi:hypothetical protein